MENYALWVKRYSDLSERESEKRRTSPDYEYSREAFVTFPHYNILSRILVEVERLVPSDMADTQVGRVLLRSAANAAYLEETRVPDFVFDLTEMSFEELSAKAASLGPRAKIVGGRQSDDDEQVQNLAMAEEVRAFAAYLDSVSQEDLGIVEPLPYRRTLSDSESDSFWQELKHRWAIEGDWYPLDRATTDQAPPDTAAFYVPGFPHDALERIVRRVGGSEAHERIFEFREGYIDPDREIDVQLFNEPYYGAGSRAGGETFWTNRSMEWVIYVSHESSITAAGRRVLEPLKEEWPEWSTWVYKGWESEHYPPVPD